MNYIYIISKSITQLGKNWKFDKKFKNRVSLDCKMTNTVRMLKTRPRIVITMLPKEATRADVSLKVEVEFILSILIQDWNFPLTCWYGFSGNPLICYLGNISDKPSKIAKIASCLHDCLVFTSSDMTIVQITTVFC